MVGGPDSEWQFQASNCKCLRSVAHGAATDRISGQQMSARYGARSYVAFVDIAAAGDCVRSALNHGIGLIFKALIPAELRPECGADSESTGVDRNRQWLQALCRHPNHKEIGYAA